jgi:hypothetical protein
LAAGRLRDGGWHFTEMAAVRQALIESWAQLKDDERREIGQLGEPEPRE